MIRKVVIRHFKRFREETFDLPGHVVFAGPNNMGKTTVLQAIAAWGLALRRWQELHVTQRHGGAYPLAPIARQTFYSVPLRTFDLLWHERECRDPIEIEVWNEAGVRITMEFVPDTSEQIRVRPKPDVEPAVARGARTEIVYIPPMTGLSTAEPAYKPQKVEQLLGLGKPGDVLRNLLVEAHNSADAWPALEASIRQLFGYRILRPDDTAADIIAEYQPREGGPRLDVASAGSGFQQLLMLLTFLHTRHRDKPSVLLVDEPDAHLHVILQDAVYGELRSLAAAKNSQLIIATHSEKVIDSVDPMELCLLLDRPRLLATTAERQQLIESLGILSHTDIMLALKSPGVLYVEDYTDIDILREWARVLDHPVRDGLNKIFWKKAVSESREGGAGIQARDHYHALKLVRDDLPALELVDGDARESIRPTEITGAGYQRARWNRYEIESYLLHPAAIARYVERSLGGNPEAARPHLDDLNRHFQDQYPPAFLRDPLGDHEYLRVTKARTRLLPPALAAAGLPGIPHKQYHEIAALMKPEEIHPEVKEKLDLIRQALHLT